MVGHEQNTYITHWNRASARVF